MTTILYNKYLKDIKELHPDIYLGLMDYPKSTLTGVMNDMITSNLDLKDNEAVKSFFSTRPHLIKVIEKL